MATITGKVTSYYNNFYSTVAQSIQVAEDFEALLALAKTGINDAWARWAKEARPETNPDASVLQDHAINGRTFDQMRADHRQFFLQTLLVRGFESYQAYLHDLLETVYARLREGMTLDALSEPLVQSLMEDKLKSLDRVGRRDDLVGELRRLGLDPIPTAEERRRERQLAGVRNLIVHNRAVVDAKFVEQFPKYPVAEGQTIVFETSAVLADLTFLSHCVGQADAKAISIYGIDAQEVESELKTEPEVRTMMAPPLLSQSGE